MDGGSRAWEGIPGLGPSKDWGTAPSRIRMVPLPQHVDLWDIGWTLGQGTDDSLPFPGSQEGRVVAESGRGSHFS